MDQIDKNLTNIEALKKVISSFCAETKPASEMKNMLNHLSTKLGVKFMKSDVCKEICEFTIKRIAERS